MPLVGGAPHPTPGTQDAVDPIRREVLRGKLDVLVNEMESTLLRTSYSPLIKEALDATAAIFDKHGRTLAQADALPAHLGMMVSCMYRVAATYSEEVAKENDVYIMNDPYNGGTHLPDFLVSVPVFYDGRLVGYTATMCHHQDVGGSAPGSTAPDAVDLHAEGLRIPLMKLSDAGTRNATLMSILGANSRVPTNLLGDLEAQWAACFTGAGRIQEICSDWGVDTLLRGSEDLLDYAELMTRLAIEQLPDGEYEFEDYINDDGMERGSIPVHVRVVISGSSIDFDFTGTGDQVAGAINCVQSSTLASVYFAIRAITGDEIPNNAGCYRPVTLTIPEGSILNCTYPAPVGCRAVTLKRVVDAIFGALGPAVPDRVPAASSGQVNIMYVGGVDKQTGKRFVGFLGVPLPGGMGARPSKDGIDVVESDVNNNMHYPTEACEMDLPVRIESIRLWTDSGGAGKYAAASATHRRLSGSATRRWSRSAETGTSFDRGDWREVGPPGRVAQSCNG